MKINSFTADKKTEFQRVAIPKVKQLISKKFVAEGEAMLKAFIDAAAAAE